jgi:thiol-disulfide isomerase/thioredoxin
MFTKEKLKKWTKEILIIGLLAIIISNVMSFFKAPELKNTNLPEIHSFLITEELYSTADATGKPLLIHFWATWCPTCKLEAGNIQTLSEKYEVITIAVKSGSNEKILAYMKENDLNFKTINDHEGTIAQKFKVPALPTSFIYDRKWKLSFTEVGYTSTLGLWLRMWWAEK